MSPRWTDADRSPTAAGFARLLAQLDADADRAAQDYERLRVALVRFFDWRGAWPPEECADETLDRLVHKLQGETRIIDVRGYAHGIARLVLLEQLRRQSLVSIADTPNLESLAAPSAPEESGLFECFERCLSGLPEESRTLVLEYYVGERAAKIDRRRRLAEALGITENALRSRVQRVRDRLERCTRVCAAATTAGIESDARHVSAQFHTAKVKGMDDH